MSAQAPLTPEPVMQALTAYWVSGALKAAIELNVFGALAGGARSGAALAAAIGAPERSTVLLADALTATGFLAKQGGSYALTPVSEAFLDPAKPSFFGGMAQIVGSGMMWDAFGRLAEVVRHDGTLNGQGTLTPDNPFWHVFAEASQAMAFGQGAALAGQLAAQGLTATRILDVAAGTGGYGISFAKAFPGAQVAFADWPGVLEHTRAHAEQHGIADRAAFLPGDLFTAELGEGYDLVLLPNIFHHFDEADCERLAARVREALKPGGAALVVEFMPDEARERAVMPLLFGLVMLASTPHGTVYTAGDYQRILGRAGFTRFEALPSHGPNQAMLAW